MALTAQTYGPEAKRYSNVVKYELEPALAFCRETVTANEAGAEDYVIGTVLGLDSTTGKYAKSVETAIDGTEVPAAVVVEDISIAATTDTSVLVLVRGPAMLSLGALDLDASFDNNAKKAAAYAALAAKNILVNPTV
jgi:hypothetical protein